MYIYLNFKEIRKKKLDICFTSLELSRKLVAWSTLEFFLIELALIQRKVTEEAIAVPLLAHQMVSTSRNSRAPLLYPSPAQETLFQAEVRSEQNGPSASSCCFCCGLYHECKSIKVTWLHSLCHDG